MNSTERMTDYFQRQISHYQKMLIEHKAISKLLDDGDVDQAETMAAAHARESAQLEKEFNALVREWQADAPTTVQRAAVRSLAKEASALAHELEIIVNEAAGDARVRRNAVRREWEAIRRGQNTIDRYRTFNDSEPDRIDKNV